MGKDAVIVVFGCRHEREYMAHADKAFLWVRKNDINPIFVFTGADPLPPNRIVQVFGDNRVIWENNSTTTEENVINVLEILEKYWIDGKKRVWVSSWYHIRRIKLFLRRAGINVNHEAFVRSYSNIALINVLVEPFAYIAAYFGFNRRPFITAIKRSLGYNV